MGFDSFEFFKCSLQKMQKSFNFRFKKKKKNINAVISAALITTKLACLSKHKTHFFFWPELEIQ